MTYFNYFLNTSQNNKVKIIHENDKAINKKEQKKFTEVNFFLTEDCEKRFVIKRNKEIQEKLKSASELAKERGFSEKLTKRDKKTKILRHEELNKINSRRFNTTRNKVKTVIKLKLPSPLKSNEIIHKRVLSFEKDIHDFKVMKKDILFKELIKRKLKTLEPKTIKTMGLVADFIEYKHKKDIIDIAPRLNDAAKAIYHSLKTRNSRIFDNYKIGYEIKFHKYISYLYIFEKIYKDFYNTPSENLNLNNIYAVIKDQINEILSKNNRISPPTTRMNNTESLLYLKVFQTRKGDQFDQKLNLERKNEQSKKTTLIYSSEEKKNEFINKNYKFNKFKVSKNNDEGLFSNTHLRKIENKKKELKNSFIYSEPFKIITKTRYYDNKTSPLCEEYSLKKADESKFKYQKNFLQFSTTNYIQN